MINIALVPTTHLTVAYDDRGHHISTHAHYTRAAAVAYAALVANRGPQWRAEIVPAPTTMALENAWRLARAHNHHWGQSVTPDRLNLGDALIRTCQRRASASDLDIWDRTLLDAAVEPARETPPRTWAEAEAISALPTHTGSGIPVPVPDARGALSARTGTRRCRWTCHSDGSVDIWIDRPSARRLEGSESGACVLHTRITPDGSLATVALGAYYQRHVNALEIAVRAILPCVSFKHLLSGACDADPEER